MEKKLKEENFKLQKDEPNYLDDYDYNEISAKSTNNIKAKNANMNYDFKVKSSDKIEGQMKNIDRNEHDRLIRVKDKSDRATVEQVLDGRINRILFKLMGKGEITELKGCISTGKEANVYYAKGVEGKELAVKIYKTSILIFKDRERYISGEFRFRRGYCKGNPRKMVAVWAEKEVRNLKRLITAGINCPNPLILKSNLIVMDFIGKDTEAAPRLKDAQVENIEEWNDIYLKLISIMRTMFKKCKLVHADFSEYNILYFEKKIYIIDVAQAVEDDHLNALSFLKRDCVNINNFFSKQNVDVITGQQLFDLITVYNLKGAIEDAVTTLQEKNSEKNKEDSRWKQIEDEQFLNIEVPRSLMEQEVDKILGNKDIKDAVDKLCGFKILETELPKKKNKKEIADKNNHVEENSNSVENSDEDEFNEEDEFEEDDYEEEEEDELSDDDEICEESEKKKEKVKKEEPFDGLTKAERKKKVKEQNREKRKNKKFTKYEKAKAIKKCVQNRK